MLVLTLSLLSLATSIFAREPVAPPKLTFLYGIDLELPPPVDIGKAPFGSRSILGITGGTFSGPKLNG
jgi:hypothetical protein